MGLTDAEFIYAEFIYAGGVNMRPDRAGAAFEEVAAQTDEIVA